MTFKKHISPLLFLIPFFTSFFSFSQQTPVIHVKARRNVLFFQTGIKSDTLVKNKSDLFFLFIPDSLKKDLVLLSENGQFQKTKDDDLFKFVYLPGLKYESQFLKAEADNSFEFKSLINGASTFEAGKIRMQLMNKKTNILIIENAFLYKPL